MPLPFQLLLQHIFPLCKLFGRTFLCQVVAAVDLVRVLCKLQQHPPAAGTRLCLETTHISLIDVPCVVTSIICRAFESLPPRDCGSIGSR